MSGAKFIYFLLIDRFHDEQSCSAILQPGRSNGINTPDDFFGGKIIPLAVYDLYLRAQKAAAPAQFTMAASLVVMTLIMGVGSSAAFLLMWRPVLSL